MARPARFGLRALLLLALSLVFLSSFALLGSAALRLTRAAFEREHAEGTRRALIALSHAVRQGGQPERLDAAIAAFASEIDARAFRIERAHGDGPSVLELGEVPSVPGVSIETARGERVTVWPGPVAARSYAPLSNLLLFYVLLTGAAVMVLAYLVLTHLIVRPLDRLTASTELMALSVRDRAPVDARAPEEGAAEVARLAASFNAMAAQLRKERAALVARLSELEATTSELRATQAQVVHGEKLASVGRLAAGVAHEIGNPLAGILGLVELLQQGELSEQERVEFLARIQRETERIHHIIFDLLDFARREPEGDASETCDLEQVVADAVALVRTQKTSRKVDIDVALAENAKHARARGQRLSQVVLNLLLNALDALQEQADGATDANLARGLITVCSELRGERCVLSVRDNGPGIAPAIEGRLFEPFATTKPPGKGTGLGLAVCHSLVEAMGGRIVVRSEPGQGACFEVELLVA